MDLSIIIVNWNTQKITCNCLESIYTRKMKLDFEVLVIDNNSSDNSVEVIRRDYPQVRIIENEKNTGFAHANNIGMKIAKGKYYLLLNSDTIILDDVIERTYAFIDKKPEAGVVGCRVLNKDKSLQPTCFMYPSPLNIIISVFYMNKLFPKNHFWGREQMTWWNRENKKHVQVVTGCYMLVKSDVVKKVGPMDDSFFMYAEETDWCYRFEKMGYKNYFIPDGEIIHLGGVSTSKVRPKMILQLRSGILQYIYKNRSRLDYILSCLFISCWFFVRTPYWVLYYLCKREPEALILTKTYCRGWIKALFGYKALKAIDVTL